MNGMELVEQTSFLPKVGLNKNMENSTVSCWNLGNWMKFYLQEACEAFHCKHIEEAR